MSQSQHLIASCAWQTQFGEAQNVKALQDALSQWSHQVMPTLIDDVMNQYCPPNQVWHIGRLELDLGKLTLEDMDETLPKRLSQALANAFERLLGQQGTRSTFEIDTLSVVETEQGIERTVEWWLLHGSLPWWHRDQQNILALVDELLRDQQALVPELLRRTGQYENVRRRIVWQWQMARVKQSVMLLEPWHGEFICQYAGQVIANQTRVSALPNDRGFQSHVWYWVLTHMLVERGSMFNTQAFIHSTMMQMAHHYQVDYDALLDQFTAVFTRLNDAGVGKAPYWLSALQMLAKQDETPAPVVPHSEQPDTLWQALQSMLHQQTRYQVIQHQQVGLAELFTDLVRLDRGRVAMILRAEGRSEKVREHIIRTFTQVELECLVEAVEPYDHHFITSHAAYTQRLLEQEQMDVTIIWRVLLTYLLVEKGSQFNRRQFVKATLERISQVHKLDYDHLLLTLTQVIVHHKLNAGQFELLAILQALRQERAKDHTRVNRQVWSVLSDYLVAGNPVGGRLTGRHFVMQGSMGAEYSTRLRTIRACLLGQQANFGYTLHQLLQQPSVASLDQNVLSERLLNLLQRSGAIGWLELRSVLAVLAPNIAPACIALLQEIFQWYQRGKLSALAGALDFTTLAKASIRTALGFARQSFSVEQWSRAVMQNLARALSMTSTRFEQQLYQAALLEQPETASGRLVKALIAGQASDHSPEVQTARPTYPEPELPWYQDDDRIYLKRGDIAQILEQWLLYGAAPQVQVNGVSQTMLQFNGAQLLEDLLQATPEQFFHWVKPLYRKDFVANRLLVSLQLEDVLSALERISPSQGFVRHTAMAVRALLVSLELPWHDREITQLILRYVLEGWMTEQWQQLSPAALLEATVLALYHSGVVSLETLLNALTAPALSVAPALQNAMADLIAQLKRIKDEAQDGHSHVANSDQTNNNDQVSKTPITHQTAGQTRQSSDQTQSDSRIAPKDSPTAYPLAINNAGLVLCQGYISALFNRLQLIEGEQFIDQEAQRSAVLYLQYLATGQTSASEQYLLLNKILCGVPLNAPVEQDMPISQADAEVIESLIEAVVNYWPAIGSSSIDGFRGNWLVRDGTLSETEDHWDLIVEKRPYDILLDRFPMSYSIIKLPWMNKPIYVTWPT